MKTFSAQEVDSAFKTAPKSVADKISSFDTANVIAEIADRYQLHIDAIAEVAEITRNIGIGLLPPESFTSELESIGITSEDAHAISTEINKTVFVPLREQLRQHKSSSNNAQTIKPPQPNSAPPVQRPVVPTRVQDAPLPPPSKPPVQQPMPPQQAPNAQPPMPSVWDTSDKVFIPANPALPQRPNENLITRVQRPRPAVPQQRSSINILERTPGASVTQKMPPQVSEMKAPAQVPPVESRAPQPAIPTPPDHLLADHEEAPMSAPPKWSAPHYEPPANLPGVMSSAPADPVLARETPSVPPPAPKPVPPPQPRPSMSQPYTSDPYREPIE